MLTRKHGVWTETDLYSFCSQTNCADGSLPDAELLVDANGRIFGTTLNGGANDAGVVFELAETAGVWSETVLHNFCGMQDCADGVLSQRALVMDSEGALFGALAAGGVHKSGLVFKLMPNGTQSEYSVVYDFCSRRDCRDGAAPDTELLLDSVRALYGTTVAGGNQTDSGTVFRLSGGALDVLHKFCAKAACPDGASPRGGVSMDASGHLFGATTSGGKHGEGAVFELAP